MKKKMLMMIAVLMVMTAVWGCSGSDSQNQEKAAAGEDADTKEGENTEEDAAEKEDAAAETKVEKISLDNADGSLIYVRHELAKDYNGADAVRIYFTYTNNSDDTKTAQSTFYPQVFQNGVECDFTSGDFTETNEAESNLSKELMKGSSLEVAFMYTLQDTANSVILKVNDQSVDGLLEGIYQEQELALQ